VTLVCRDGSRLELDPVTAKGPAFGVSDVFQDATVVLNRPRRGDVVHGANDQRTVQAEPACLIEHLAQRPGSQPTSARRRPDAVSDVAADPVQKVVKLVP
jgi:hypothetical protein